MRSYNKTLGNGFLLLTHGKTTTLLAGRTTQERQCGLSKATHLQNGNRRVRIHCYGFTENVSVPFLYRLSVLMKVLILRYKPGQARAYSGMISSQYLLVRELMQLLSSTIIENSYDMRKQGLATLAIFYCDFRGEDKKNLRGLVSSLLVQLCYQSDSYSTILSNFYLAYDSGSRHASDEALIKCLKDMLKHPGQAPVYIIIDGLDECPNVTGRPSPREKVLKVIQDLVGLRLPTLRICITSRPENDIRRALGPFPFRHVSLHDERGQIQDIVDYIRSSVNTDWNMERWREEDKELVIETLTKKAGGM